PDIAVTNSNGGGRLSVFLANNDNPRTFQAAQNYRTIPGPSSVQLADVNNDGRPDLVTANQFGNSLSVALGNGDGTFKQAQFFNVGHSSVNVVVSDFNGDGKPDL